MRFCSACGRKLAWGDSDLCGRCEEIADREDKQREDGEMITEDEKREIDTAITVEQKKYKKLQDEYAALQIKHDRFEQWYFSEAKKRQSQWVNLVDLQAENERLRNNALGDEMRAR